MARVYSIRTVLRQTPNRLLRQFLDRLGYTDLAIPWEALRERDIEPIVEALNTFSSTQLNEVEGALRIVYNLACDTGIAAILEAGELSRGFGAPCGHAGGRRVLRTGDVDLAQSLRDPRPS
jgi:hypothetical protein